MVYDAKGVRAMTDNEAFAKICAASASLMGRPPPALRIVAFAIRATPYPRSKASSDGREAYRSKCYRARTAVVVPRYYPDTRST